MLITNVRTRICKHYLFVEIETDSGIKGLGEAGCWSFLKATETAILKFKDYLIGKDPFQIEDITQSLYHAQFFRGSVIMSAISAIDIALWDIKGKALGVPVYELLGGKTRDKVRVYASVMKSKDEKPEELAKKYVALKEQGFTAAKVFLTEPVIRPDGSNEFFSSRLAMSVERVKAVREAVGDNFDLVLEVHRSMSVAQAVAFGREVEKYRPMILEDPVAPDNFDSMAEVASKVATPIATGERFINIQEFKDILVKKAAQYVRPDVCTIGGISAAKKVAAIAEAFGAQIIPHNPLGPVSTAACLHICASVPNLGIQELPDFCLNGKEDAMVKEPLRFADGCLIIPNAPGIGIELVDNAEELYPMEERGNAGARRAFDGSVRDF